MKIQILVNNKITNTEATNVAEIASELGLPERGVALAVNQRIISRGEWLNTPLQQNDSITIIKAAFGG